MGNQTFASFTIGMPEGTNADNAEAVNAALVKLLNGASIEEIGFNSPEEQAAAFADPRYEAPGVEGAAFRHLVSVMIQNSSTDVHPETNESKAITRTADWKSDEEKAILREWITEQMSDPRYESSTLFRKQIRETLEKNPGLFEKASPSPTRVRGRVQLQADDFEAVQKVRNDERLARIEAEKQEMIARAEAYAKQQTIDVTGNPASEEDDSE